MDCVAQLPMWSQPVLSPAFGAAQFTAASGSTIELTSRLPNIFGTDGDYIDFMFFQSSASAWTVFGSTVSPDAIVINDNTITITDGTNSDSITLLASLSTTEWNHIRLIRNGSTIECYVATGSDSLVLELQTLDVIPLDLDIIGKNQGSLTHVRAARLYGNDGDYFSLASPSTDIQGDENGFGSRLISFYLASAHDGVILDCMNGNSGWRLEVRNVYLSDCRIVFSVGNGTDAPTELESEIIKAGSWYSVDINLEVLVGEPDPGDTTIEGFDPHASNFYVGSERGSSKYFDGKLQSLLMLSSKATTAQWDWWTEEEACRSLSEIGAETEIATADCTNGWPLSETSGTRADIFGAEDLTEVPGIPFSDGFEAVTGGAFDNWTKTEAGSTTVNVDSSNQRTGTYCARVDIDGSGSDGSVVNQVTADLNDGKEYTISVWAAATATGPTFRMHVNTSGDAATKTISSTSYTEYTHTFTAFGANLRLIAATGSNESIYFDDVTITSSEVISVVGLRSSFTNAAAFDGYLKDVKINALAGYVELPLLTDATDIGGDSNDGTASNVTFVTSDPGA